jgi:glycosyltransferase involved in cell wall biosynthesis
MEYVNVVKLPSQNVAWEPGVAPVAVILISLNEGHNMEAVCQNLAGWAQEVFLVDSYSQDDTLDIALSHGVQVVQRRFRGFGDQWNFALQELPITARWTMKLDPDERLSDELKANLLAAVQLNESDGLSLTRRLWFMGRPLSVHHTLIRLWRTGRCRFTDISVNEYPIVEGRIMHVAGDMEHHDSPDLDHWLEKQNRYTTAEAISAYKQSPMADTPRLMGTALQRRMWIKKNFYRLPFRYLLLFLYNLLWQDAWRAGWVGYVWARLRSDVMRLREYKRREMELTGRFPVKRIYGPGQPDPRVQQSE